MIAIALRALWIFGSEKPENALFGVAAAIFFGGAVGAGMHEAIQPDDEAELRRKFNDTSHGG